VSGHRVVVVALQGSHASPFPRHGCPVVCRQNSVTTSEHVQIALATSSGLQPAGSKLQPECTAAALHPRGRVLEPIDAVLNVSKLRSLFSFTCSYIHTWPIYNQHIFLHLLHDLSMYIIYIYLCLCCAFTAGLPLLSLWKLATPSVGSCVGSCVVLLVLVLELVVVCGLCLRAGRGIILRLVVLVEGSPRHGRNTECNSISRF
jgi:hypothetical protein